MAKSNELGQLASLLTVDASTQNILFGPTIAPTVTIDVNSGIVTVPNLNATSTTISDANIVDGSVDRLVVGIGTLDNTDLKNTNFLSISQRTSYTTGNVATIDYGSESTPDVIFVSGATGNISLNVNNIPTDSSFNNRTFGFSVVVSQTGTARTCTSVSLNGKPKTIKWFSGALERTIIGVTTFSGIDIFNFFCVNTVGSASTVDNYQVLGVANGCFY